MYSIRRIMQDRELIVVIGLAVFFFFLYAWFYAGSQGVFTSPDETANYFFTSLFAETGTLSVSDSLLIEIDATLYPRSVSVLNGTLVPASFVGLPLLYGAIGKFFGTDSILYITPLLSVLGVIFLYLLLRHVFNQRIALVSSILVLLLPPFWMYASRGMFHNVPFLSLLIIGIYLIVQSVQQIRTSSSRLAYFALSGLVLGLALSMRMSEAVWVSVVVVTILVLHRKQYRLRQLSMLILGGIISLIPLFIANTKLYGSPFSFAYQAPVSRASVVVGSGDGFFVSVLKTLFAPFGIDWADIGLSTYHYLLLALPWISIVLLLGLLWMFRSVVVKWISRYIVIGTLQPAISAPQKTYTLLFVVISALLVLYYGSFTFTEFIEPDEIILGSSYLRYWLPLFVFGMPFAALGIQRAMRLIPAVRLRMVATIIILGAVTVLSINAALADSVHGLAQLRETNQSVALDREALATIVADDAVFISGTADKQFFSQWRVIYQLPRDPIEAFDVIAAVHQQAEVYVISNSLDPVAIGNMDTINHLTVRLEPVNINLTGGIRLYRIVPL